MRRRLCTGFRHAWPARCARRAGSSSIESDPGFYTLFGAYLGCESVCEPPVQRERETYVDSVSSLS
jgi:hypothetical protein